MIHVSEQVSLPPIELGRRGENLAVKVEFDYSAWITEFGDGEFRLYNMRSADTEGYPVTVDIEGTNATWNVTSADTAYEGIGECQVVYVVDEVIKKSAVYRTRVLPSITENGEPPEPLQPWMDIITQAVSEVDEDATNARMSELNAEAYKNQAEQSKDLAQAAAYIAVNAVKDTITITDPNNDGNLVIEYR